MIKDTLGQDRLIKSKNSLWARQILIASACFGVSVFLLKMLWDWRSTDLILSRDDITLAQIERGSITREINSVGKIVAANAPIIYSPEAGRVRMLVHPGERVEVSQIIAEVTSVELRNNLEKEQSVLKRLNLEYQRNAMLIKHTLLLLRQQVQQTEVEWQAAVREIDRAEKSISIQLISQQDFERAQDALAKAELAYQQAKEEMDIQSESLKFEHQTKAYEVEAQGFVVSDLERRVTALQVKSPVDGMLGGWFVEQDAQLDMNQAIMTVVDLSEYEAELAINEGFADELALGMDVTLSASGHTFYGSVSLISPEINNNQVMARVRIHGTPEIALRQNQRLTATIVLESKSNVLMVRRGAFIQSSGGQWSYRLVNKHADRVSLSTGISNLSHIEILSGVEEGESIVISSLEPFNNLESVVVR